MLSPWVDVRDSGEGVAGLLPCISKAATAAAAEPMMIFAEHASFAAVGALRRDFRAVWLRQPGARYHSQRRAEVGRLVFERLEHELHPSVRWSRGLLLRVPHPTRRQCFVNSPLHTGLRQCLAEEYVLTLRPLALRSVCALSQTPQSISRFRLKVSSSGQAAPCGARSGSDL